MELYVIQKTPVLHCLQKHAADVQSLVQKLRLLLCLKPLPTDSTSLSGLLIYYLHLVVFNQSVLYFCSVSLGFKKGLCDLTYLYLAN